MSTVPPPGPQAAAAPPPGLDPERLRAHLDRERPGLVAGPLSARLIEGGRSNLTYDVTDGSSRWVARRPPLGHVLATAHDMKREFRVISGLHPTKVPVPAPVLLCEDESVLGSPFYVMEFVAGTPYRTAEELAPLGPERTRAAVLGLVDTLVELHAVDPAAVGLGDFGRPEGFLDRQLRRWGKQLDASRNRELAGIDELHAALGRALPDSPAPTVVHGDYRLDNVLIGGPDDGIRAVLDWEMSTLGDPLTDLGLLVMYGTKLDLPGSPISTTAAAAGHPTADEIVARYADASGRDVSAVHWYTAFAWFKLAVILEGIHYRYTLGQTVGAGFDRIGELVPVFIEHGLTTLTTPQKG
ncbi:phosphotransferase family protein [Streptomyces sp. NPDC054863]